MSAGYIASTETCALTLDSTPTPTPAQPPALLTLKGRANGDTESLGSEVQQWLMPFLKTAAGTTLTFYRNAISLHVVFCSFNTGL